VSTELSYLVTPAVLGELTFVEAAVYGLAHVSLMSSYLFYYLFRVIVDSLILFLDTPNLLTLRDDVEGWVPDLSLSIQGTCAILYYFFHLTATYLIDFV
jgi:hypothetical protein